MHHKNSIIKMDNILRYCFLKNQNNGKIYGEHSIKILNKGRISILKWNKHCLKLSLDREKPPSMAVLSIANEISKVDF